MVGSGDLPIRLSLLDTNHPRWAIELAPELDRLGYFRYWLGEHHSPIQSGSPEVLTAIIAGMCPGLRVGPAGILLRYYSPFKVAQTFRLLDDLYRGRIDLGVGRGLGADGPAAQAMLEGRTVSTEDYERKVVELDRLLHGRSPDSNPSSSGLYTSGASPSQFWILGTSKRAAELAGKLGASFAFAEFIALMSDPSVDGPGIVNHYRTAFEPSTALDAPRCCVATAGACRESEREARSLSVAPIAGPPPLVGTREAWRRRFAELRERYRTQEIVLLELSERFADRRRSLELFAEAAGLTAREAP